MLVRMGLLAVMVLSARSNDDGWMAALERANGCFVQSDYQGALAALQTVNLDGLPEYARATVLTRLGVVYFQLGDFRPAERSYRQAVDLWDRVQPRDSSRVVALVSLATTYHRLGEYSKSETIVNRAMAALEESSGTPAEFAGALQNLAALRQVEHRNLEAEQLYLQVIRLLDQSSTREPERRGIGP